MPPINSPRVVRRTISQTHGRALEILGHAIEYLEDELSEEGFRAFDKIASVQAIEILKARNREIYFSCPITPLMTDRLMAILKAVSRRFTSRGVVCPSEIKKSWFVRILEEKGGWKSVKKRLSI